MQAQKENDGSRTMQTPLLAHAYLVHTLYIPPTSPYSRPQDSLSCCLLILSTQRHGETGSISSLVPRGPRRRRVG